MATKDHCLSPKDKQNIDNFDYLSSRQSNNNLNLNQNHHGLNGNLIWSKDDSSESKKNKFYDSQILSNDLQTRKESKTWNPFSKNNLPSNDMNIDSGFEKKELKDKKYFSSNPNVNSSTLSLHIVAYENYHEVSSNQNDKCEKKEKEDKGEIGMIKQMKQLFVTLIFAETNPFEFPRQKEDDQDEVPEVIKFKATQKVFNPNGGIELRNGRKLSKETSFSSSINSVNSGCIITLDDEKIAEFKETSLVRCKDRENHLQDHWLKKMRSNIHGFGVFAIKEFKKNTVLTEYKGRSVNNEKANKIEAKRGEDAETYLFRVSEEKVLDASKSKSLAHFINASCDPNVYAVIEDERIFIVASKKIKKGDELLLNYNFEKINGGFSLPCNCGSKFCRQFMDINPSLY
uniref:Histone-lysine N-methyltransferase n=1 Tax=Panagrolaimus sp. ES5 TaxID=591445 RepID=A0AC34FP19_9BILA